MSDFGDQLRENLASREAEARAAAEAQSAYAEAASIYLLHPDDVAAALVGNVFPPLVEEFGEVMQAEGVVYALPPAGGAADPDAARGRPPLDGKKDPNPKSEIPNKS